MKSEREFCINCREDVDYKIESKEMSAELKGKQYKYKGAEAHCVNCGEEIYIEEINDSNLRALYDQFRKENDIVSLDVVVGIIEKYRIGKRPLSLLLGWGEHTYSRFCDGDLPTKQYSDILRRIYDVPEFYNEILETNKDKLVSISAYEKSKRAVNEVLASKLVDNSKMYEVIEYLLSQSEDLTPMALQKALYYIQGFNFAFNNEFMFEDECQAWRHGPVYRDVYEEFKKYRYDTIECVKDGNSSSLLDYEKVLIESISKYICCFGGKMLEMFTHIEEPWVLTRKGLDNNVGSERVIPKELIGEFFLKVKDEYSMKTYDDIRKYSNYMFKKLSK